MSKKIVTELKSIHLIFLWIYRLLFYTGCLSFRLKGEKLCLTRFTKIYTNIVRTTLVVGFVGGFAVKLHDEQSASAMLQHLPPILKFVMTFEGVTSTLTYIQVSVAMDVQKKAHIRLAEQFQYLDKRLQTEFPQITWNYHKSVRKYTPLTLFVINFYVIVSMTYLFNITHCLCDMVTTFVIAISYAFLTAAPGTVAFLHLGSMDILRLRYRLICRLLRTNKNGQHIKAVQRLSVYCRRYTDLISDINHVFGYVVAAGVFYDFGILTNLVYLICEKVFEAKAPIQDYVFILLFMVPRMYKIIIMSVYGKQLDREKRRCIHDLSVHIEDLKHKPEAKDLLHSFLHWKMQSNHDVTLGNTIRCNLNVIFLVLNGIANYVLILIQLQLQQNSITNLVRKSFKWRRTAELVEIID